MVAAYPVNIFRTTAYAHTHYFIVRNDVNTRFEPDYVLSRRIQKRRILNKFPAPIDYLRTTFPRRHSEAANWQTPSTPLSNPVESARKIANCLYSLFIFIFFSFHFNPCMLLANAHVAYQQIVVKKKKTITIIKSMSTVKVQKTDPMVNFSFNIINPWVNLFKIYKDVKALSDSFSQFWFLFQRNLFEYYNSSRYPYFWMEMMSRFQLTIHLQFSIPKQFVS